jgi:hypothetical protein
MKAKVILRLFGKIVNRKTRRKAKGERQKEETVFYFRLFTLLVLPYFSLCQRLCGKNMLFRPQIF